jgi:general secretion pathway protein E
MVNMNAASSAQDLQNELNSLSRGGVERASRIVDRILADAVRRGASDVHLEPSNRSIDIRYRLDGVLWPIASIAVDVAPNLVARLKVLAELLTYRMDIPQEGSLREAFAAYGTDMRVSTFPTVHGEKVVVRLFDMTAQARDLEQLGLDQSLHAVLLTQLRGREGAILFTGPSGSGKTTTIYACLRYMARARDGRHIVTIEDPVEQIIEGVSQSQARPGTEFDFARGLRSLLRQDPEVIMIGEIRDRETAGIAIQASLTGHLVLSTLHAGSACGVIGRLLDMGIEPYLLTSAIKAIVNQRLVRRLCPHCSNKVQARARPGGCEQCSGTGYRGRVLLAELLLMNDPLCRQILAGTDTRTLEKVAAENGLCDLRLAAAAAVAEALTAAEEIERILGPAPADSVVSVQTPGSGGQA